MSWNTLSGYLKKFKVIKPPKEFVRGTVVDIISDVANISVSPQCIECGRSVVVIKTPNPAMKNQLFLYKDKILEEFEKRIGSRAPKEIIFK